MSFSHQEANRIAAELRGLRKPETASKADGRKPSSRLDAAGPVLEFMQSFFARNDQLPTLACIATKFGYAGPESARWHVLRLERLGKIERNEAGRYRFAKGPR